MKKIQYLALFVIVILMYSCKTEQPHPNYVKLTGTITNTNSDTIALYEMGGASKEITINDNGSFVDTFKVKGPGNDVHLLLERDKVMIRLYAENGSNIHVEADTKEIENTLKFTKDFADYNNYINEKFAIMGSDIGFDKKTWYRFEETEFNEHINILKKALNEALNSYQNITADQKESEHIFIERYIKNISSKYKSEHSFASKLNKGSVSPVFENYENIDGTQTSLSDFKGKYVFIDVWATWCVPCKVQIPFLEELEEEYKNENIVFISMSVDKQDDKEKWIKMVKDKNMSGVQILAPNETGSDFTRAYNINSIPRFIFIDPQGNIVDFDAPKPSNKEAIHNLLDVVKS
ncbi:TlpA disulfide reductase family protein [Aestuariibaculum sp. YM273]|uniref:TlpA family protein disulfide reductase n=1 Tax=Aestuariibaculum sp. YM273 TaxID=3070659 RepID=UPI0027DDF744|nr:TlpA disulfide reductase family protein [Aestuariibaculum sp. YM273]WMI64131.1 TlpA disulfide reductase family protein [Aestuariibaculum sp. YM273]